MLTYFCHLGLGRTIPDPKDVYVTEDGVTIPFGKPVDTERTDLSLLYNEFVLLYLFMCFLAYTSNFCLVEIPTLLITVAALSILDSE